MFQYQQKSKPGQKKYDNNPKKKSDTELQQLSRTFQMRQEIEESKKVPAVDEYLTKRGSFYSQSGESGDSSFGGGVQMKENPLQRQQAEEQESLQSKQDTLQRFVKEEEENKTPVQAKTAQMTETEDEEELVQGKFTQKKLGRESQSTRVSEGTTTQMPEEVQAKMESSFGTSFDNVNIHQNDNNAIQMNALAYTQGNDVHFAPGQYNPQTKAGQELLGHELTHVVQQKQGRVAETKQSKGVSVNDSPALENEADEMGKKVAQSNYPSNIFSVKGKANNNAIQAKWSEKKKKRKFKRAKKKHDKNRNRLKKLVESGLNSPNRMLKNSCEAIKRNVVKLFAITKTGDSAKRQKSRNKIIDKYNAKGGKQLPQDTNVRYFPDPFSGNSGDIFSAPTYYNWQNIEFDINIHVHRAEAAGFAKDGIIAIPEPADKTDDSELNSYIIHEVQHIMDRHENDSSSSDISRYKSEYRAYSYANASSFSGYDNTTPKMYEGYSWTERQYKIFTHIRTSYKYVKEAWNNTDPVKQNEFRNAVVTYLNADTEGVNKYNSIRVNYFYDALNKIKKEPLVSEFSLSSPTIINSDKKTGAKNNILSDKFKTSSLHSKEVQELIKVSFMDEITKLQSIDADYILNEGKALKELMAKNLDIDTFKFILNLLYSAK